MTLKGGKGKTNSALKSWVTFVKKIQKEEGISYPEAMKRASARKSEWKRGGDMTSSSMSGSSSSMSEGSSGSTMGGAMSSSMGSSSMGSAESGYMADSSASLSGGKRRTKKTKKSKKTKKTKSRKSRKSRKR